MYADSCFVYFYPQATDIMGYVQNATVNEPFVYLMEILQGDFVLNSDVRPLPFRVLLLHGHMVLPAFGSVSLVFFSL